MMKKPLNSAMSAKPPYGESAPSWGTSWRPIPKTSAQPTNNSPNRKRAFGLVIARTQPDGRPSAVDAARSQMNNIPPATTAEIPNGIGWLIGRRNSSTDVPQRSRVNGSHANRQRPSEAVTTSLALRVGGRVGRVEQPCEVLLGEGIPGVRRSLGQAIDVLDAKRGDERALAIQHPDDALAGSDRDRQLATGPTPGIRPVVGVESDVYDEGGAPRSIDTTTHRLLEGNRPLARDDLVRPHFTGRDLPGQDQRVARGIEDEHRAMGRGGVRDQGAEEVVRPVDDLRRKAARCRCWVAHTRAFASHTCVAGRGRRAVIEDGLPCVRTSWRRLLGDGALDPAMPDRARADGRAPSAQKPSPMYSTGRVPIPSTKFRIRVAGVRI